MLQRAETTHRGCKGAVRLLAVATLYYAIVFGVGLVLGPVRVLWLEPHMPRILAVLCEAPILLLAMYFASRFAIAKLDPPGGTLALIALGLLALLFQQTSEVTLGILLFGRTGAQHAATFRTPAGGVYLALLAAFVVMPVCVARLTAREQARADPIGNQHAT